MTSTLSMNFVCSEPLVLVTTPAKMQASTAATSTLRSTLEFLQTSHTKSKAKEGKRAIQRPSGLDLKLHVRGPSGPGTMHDPRSVVLLSLKWRVMQLCTSETDTVESATHSLLARLSRDLHQTIQTSSHGICVKHKRAHTKSYAILLWVATTTCTTSTHTWTCC